MSNSYSAEVWLNSHRWDALETELEKQGTNIEKYLQDYLVELYRELVPADQVSEIEEIIRQEQLREQAEREARRVFSAFRLREGGKSRYLATEFPVEFLGAAHLLRDCIRKDAGNAAAYERKIQGVYEITPKRFDELTQARLDNTVRVAGVFELDFDKKVFSAVHLMDGWQSYWFEDVSAAAYHAFRKESASFKERLQKLADRLDGKELTDLDLCPPLKALRNLQPGDLLFTEPAERTGRLLDFQVDCASDTVQMEVFGPKVRTSAPGSWLDIFVSYDAVRQDIRDRLDLTLYRKDGAWEKTFTYELAPEERELLRTELEAHCQTVYGMSLNGRFAELVRKEEAVPVLDDGSRRLDVERLTFEDEISECDGKLNFYIPVDFDPDAVFGTNVTDTSNDDWLNVYASYDLEDGQADSGLTVFLHCGDGYEFEFSYPLSNAERERLDEKRWMTMTVEQRQAPDGKPKDRSYLEKDLPASLQKALDEYIQGEKDHVSYMDCLWGELYGAINSNQWCDAITLEQADYLRAKYLY